ncbi:MAG: universal stress protein [Streptosporangiaceae bacterium]
MPKRPIVVGVDGSPGSQAALRWAAATALVQQRELVAVRVWEPPILAPYAPAASRQSALAERGRAAAGLTAAVQEISAGMPGMRVRTVFATGLTARVLLNLAEGADLLVLGRHQPALQGSPVVSQVARACFQNASCPVVLVRQHEPLPGPRVPGDSLVEDVSPVRGAVQRAGRYGVVGRYGVWREPGE